MTAVEQCAYISVGRACGFAGLGILSFMVGLSFDPEVSAKSGGGLLLLMTTILVFRAMTAPARPYKQTETWLMLDDADRPAPGVAQQVIGQTLQTVYLWFAQCCAGASALLWAMATILSFFG
ncbi:MAG: hypothetical protein JNM20_06375 [Rhizobiales bacterium]|nr:hypothetical protein [Hyphomicrobiales bacterium]